MSQATDRQIEASQYTLRATFYYRASRRWEAQLELLKAQHKADTFAATEEVGISSRAAQRVSDLKIPPFVVFAFPLVLQGDPRLIQYYRSLALLSQKGLTRLAFATNSLEQHGGRLTADRALTLAKVLNGLICLHIESDAEWTLDRARIAAILNLGSQVNGAWRNEIGVEGSRQVKVLLTSLLGEGGYIDSLTLEDGTRAELPASPETAARVREIRVTNGYLVRFGSEPDVAVRNPRGILAGTIEVKYGSDPAGALERYGAARKSFEAAAQENARVQNLYLANAVTEEVRRRIADDRLVQETFEFSRISVDPQERQRFLRFVTRRLLDLG